MALLRDMENCDGQSIIVVGERHCDNTLKHLEGVMGHCEDTMECGYITLGHCCRTRNHCDCVIINYTIGMLQDSIVMDP